MANAQQDPQQNIDSLRSILREQSATDSILKVHGLYTKIGRAYEAIHRDSAVAWYRKQLAFVQAHPSKSAIKDSLEGSVYLDISYLMGFIGYPTQEEVQTGLAYADSAFAVLKNSQYLQLGIRALNNKGLMLININRFDEALKPLIRGLELSESITVVKAKNFALQGLYLNIGKAYIGLEQWPLAAQYTRKAISIKGIPRFRMIALNNLAAVFLESEVLDSTLYYAGKSLFLADSLGDDYHKLLNRVNMAEAYLKLERFDEAIPLIRENIRVSEAFEYPYGIAAGLNQEAKYFAAKQELDSAMEALLRAEELVEQVADKELMIDTWDNLEEVYVLRGNYKKAYDYQTKRVALRDSLLSAENTENFNRLLLRFETSEKEKKLVEQELELKESEASLAAKNVQIILISGGLLLSILIAILVVFRTRQVQERKLQSALIAEKEKGLVAVLSATEEERKRISKDLHDGIGQKLTALRMGLLELSAQSEGAEKKRLLEITEDFSQSAEELRQISHQMMPKALMEQGLVQALEDLVESTFKYSKIKPHFEHFQLQDRYAEKLEVSLFRIAQELLNNALKHSDATEINLQLMELKKKLILIVEDNGRGLNHKSTQGQGFYNIKSRLDVVKGVVNYEPGPQTGMLATITIPLA